MKTNLCVGFTWKCNESKAILCMGSVTQNAQQQPESMGHWQGRLHGGGDMRSTGAAWAVYFKLLAMEVGWVGISQHCDTQHKVSLTRRVLISQLFLLVSFQGLGAMCDSRGLRSPTMCYPSNLLPPTTPLHTGPSLFTTDIYLSN